jgi:glycosyltransferase involved in cell wall biosynthesis
VASEKPDPEDKQNGVTRGADGPTHANGASGDDDRWLRSIVENGMEVVKVVELDGTLIYANAAFERILGHPRMRFTFENDDDRETFVRLGWITPEQGVLIRGSGIDPDEFSPPQSPPTGTPLVLFASRLLATKGVAEFVEAARRLSARGLNARFAIAGRPDPKNPESIRESDLARWQNEGSVEILGHQRNMPDLLRSTSITELLTKVAELTGDAGLAFEAPWPDVE